MRRILCSLALIGAAAAASAQAPTTTSTQMPPRPAAAPQASAFIADYMAEVDAVGKKLVDLAQAVPADKYGWRPGPGVRSIGEVYMHIAGGNSSIPAFLGAKRMDGITRESEKTVTDKAKIVELLQKSIANAKAAGQSVTEADLDKKVKTFGGREMTERQVLLLVMNHMHEHLGQSIAYARMNGITPPWSEGG
jgi:uncharacterized damage-inducible protein DinB